MQICFDFYLQVYLSKPITYTRILWPGDALPVRVSAISQLNAWICLELDGSAESAIGADDERILSNFVSIRL